jgi:DNA-binding response OmpR family regulator
VLEEEKVDLILMDRNLPGTEGSEFIASLRRQGVNTPVIFISAKDKDEEIEQGFERGGDDYLTKPFSMKELILRVKAILRRTQKVSAEGNITYRDITINPASRTVIIENNSIELTKLEFDLLYEFISNQNIVLDREYLLEHVWGNDEVYQDRTVNVAINRLKDKIDPDKSKDYLKTVRGVGYTLC